MAGRKAMNPAQMQQVRADVELLVSQRRALLSASKAAFRALGRLTTHDVPHRRSFVPLLRTHRKLQMAIEFAERKGR